MKIALVIYRRFFSPFLHGFSRLFSGNPYSGCKFEPTCSCYFEQSVEKHGWIRGLPKALYRVFRCNPLSRSGGYDPV